jgi:hypothetical protein
MPLVDATEQKNPLAISANLALDELVSRRRVAGADLIHLGCVRRGAVPYYMFIERDTGAREYFSVPLVRAVQIYRDAALRFRVLSVRRVGP